MTNLIRELEKVCYNSGIQKNDSPSYRIYDSTNGGKMEDSELS